jgi:hypothetical protein
MLSTKTKYCRRAESVVSAQLYFYALRRFRAAEGIDLQDTEKLKAERFTELTFLFFIRLNAERFTESLTQAGRFTGIGTSPGVAPGKR